AGQRKVGTGGHEWSDHFAWATEGMKEKATGRTRARLEYFQKPSPSLQAMDADREVPLGRQPQLPGENLALIGQIVPVDPAIQADFANSAWGSVQAGDEIFLPPVRALF